MPEPTHRTALASCEYTRPRTTVCRTLPGNVTRSNGDHPHFVFNDSRVTTYGVFKSRIVNEPTYPSSTRPKPLPYSMGRNGATNFPGFAAHTRAILLGLNRCSFISHVVNAPYVSRCGTPLVPFCF